MRLRRDELALEQLVERAGDVELRRERVERAAPEDAADERRVLEHALSAASSPSIRAAIRACTESGIRFSEPASSSASTRAVSSRNSGLPSAFSSASARCAGGTSACASSASTSSRLCSGVSGPSSSESARGLPPPQLGRSSSRSGRATHTISTGDVAQRAREVLDHVEQRLLGPVHVLEDEHERLRLRELLGPERHGPGQLAGRPPSSAAPSTPSATASRSATASLSQQRRSFSNASDAGASSAIPADALIIEASGQ